MNYLRLKKCCGHRNEGYEPQTGKLMEICIYAGQQSLCSKDRCPIYQFMLTEKVEDAEALALN